MKTIRKGFKTLGMATIIISGFLAVNVAFADPIGSSATWLFDLPSTAVASQNPPYPLVATLTLTQTAAGVEFSLAPNWSSPGYNPGVSFVEGIDYVYMGPALTGGTPGAPPPSTIGNFRWDAGAAIKDFSYETNQNNMDSGYKTNDQHIHVTFGDKNDPLRFDDNFTSTEWTVLNVDPSNLVSLSDFTGTYAESNSKPTPTRGVISVTSYSLPDPKPTPSNWVTSPGVSVPEPSTMLLVGSGLIGLLGFRKKFKK